MDNQKSFGQPSYIPYISNSDIILGVILQSFNKQIRKLSHF